MVDIKAGVGIVYGRHQMTVDEVQSFVEWLEARGLNYGRGLSLWKAGSCEYNAIWLSMSALLLGEWEQLQQQFINERVGVE